MKNIQDQKPGEGYKEGTGCLFFLGDTFGDITFLVLIIIVIVVIVKLVQYFL